nr:DUF2585 domain-containing protein [uncultured Gellertiella sp.]
MSLSVPMPDRDRLLRLWGLPALIVIALQAGTEHLMGHVWTCACGTVKLFEADVASSGNSQQFADWYTPSHIEHGFLFFGLGYLLLRRFPRHVWFYVALGLESFWEILENTPLIIDRYRAATISLNYYGDSVLNSVMDLIMMMAGFWLAARLPVWLTVALAVSAELLTLYIIRDNLTLNVLMLIHPVEAIRTWQGGL